MVMAMATRMIVIVIMVLMVSWCWWYWCDHDVDVTVIMMCSLCWWWQAGRPLILIDGPFGDYEKLVKEGHKTVNFYVNGEVMRRYKSSWHWYILQYLSMCVCCCTKYHLLVVSYFVHLPYFAKAGWTKSVVAFPCLWSVAALLTSVAVNLGVGTGSYRVECNMKLEISSHAKAVHTLDFYCFSRHYEYLCIYDCLQLKCVLQTSNGFTYDPLCSVRVWRLFLFVNSIHGWPQVRVSPSVLLIVLTQAPVKGVFETYQSWSVWIVLVPLPLISLLGYLCTSLVLNELLIAVAKLRVLRALWNTTTTLFLVNSSSGYRATLNKLQYETQDLLE